ncbi:MAG: hypothetical protein QOG66_2996, partial [Methylobacteriaceae bacterium]|nr:hypothetical protein [Methylobacteriaceae bacterium]
LNVDLHNSKQGQRGEGTAEAAE